MYIANLKMNAYKTYFVMDKICLLLLHSLCLTNIHWGPGTTRACTHRVQKLGVHKDLTMRSPEYGATADFFTPPHRQVNKWKLIICRGSEGWK